MRFNPTTRSFCSGKLGLGICVLVHAGRERTSARRPVIKGVRRLVSK
jgi:hypothetical protein